QPWFDIHMGPHQLVHRDLTETTPQHAPIMSFYHPRMQETLIAAAAAAGAETIRGATVTGVRPGATPGVSFQEGGRTREVTARMVVAADGRGSAARGWAGFTVQRDAPKQLMAGTLLEDCPLREDTSFVL